MTHDIPDPRDPEALVKQFHTTYAMPVVTDGARGDYERIHMRMRLIMEEMSELIEAVYGPAAAAHVRRAMGEVEERDEGTRDVVATADALADLVYVIYGMALESGINLPAVLGEVQASNLSKLGADGKPVLREDGKVLKGPGFFPPDVAAALEKPIAAEGPSSR